GAVRRHLPALRRGALRPLADAGARAPRARAAEGGAGERREGEPVAGALPGGHPAGVLPAGGVLRALPDGGDHLAGAGPAHRAEAGVQPPRVARVVESRSENRQRPSGTPLLFASCSPPTKTSSSAR